MTRLAVLLAAAALTLAQAGPALAQADTPQAVYDSFDSLLGSREQREIYALPPERYWRATGPLRVRLAGGRDFGLAPALVALADDLGRATGVEIAVQAAAVPLPSEPERAIDLEILIVSRPLGAEFAAGLGLDPEMRRRFVDGRWPALFDFRRDDLFLQGRRRGVVLLADDLDPAELEAFLSVAMVWAMGGASIGDGLQDIIEPAGRPRLTALGRLVFALMYDPALTIGQPLAETRAAARRLLGLAG